MRFSLIMAILIIAFAIFLFTDTIKSLYVYNNGQPAEVKILHVKKSTRIKRNTELLFYFDNKYKKVYFPGPRFHNLNPGDYICLKHDVEKNNFVPCQDYMSYFVVSFLLELFVLFFGIYVILKCKV